jgi:transcriptional regulator with XRE-family HTH domain
MWVLSRLQGGAVLVSEAKTIGDRLKLLRRERSMTRNELADESGVSADVIEKLEHGRRQTARVTWLIKLAGGLRAELSRRGGRRYRPGGMRGRGRTGFHARHGRR